MSRNFALIVLRKLGELEEAQDLLRESLSRDPLDCEARYLAGGLSKVENQVLLDKAIECARAGLFQEAIEIVNRADEKAKDGSVPMMRYACGYFLEQLGDKIGRAHV